MKLLLDTHIWLWCHLDPGRLGRVRKELNSSSNELWLSPISIWEMSCLLNRNRVTLHIPAEEWIPSAMLAIPTVEAPFTHEVALETRRISLPHRDPADRFLVATANVFGLTLVTADKVLLEAKACPTMASR